MDSQSLRSLPLAIFAVILVSSTAWADFIGKLSLEPKGCEETKRCTLGADFGYIDQSGIGWKADKGNVTDGASIPRWAQKFVGIPFEPAALPAAVLHDHYSEPPPVCRRLQSKYGWSPWKKVTEPTDFRLRCVPARFG